MTEPMIPMESKRLLRSPFKSKTCTDPKGTVQLIKRVLGENFRRYIPKCLVAFVFMGIIAATTAANAHDFILAMPEGYGTRAGQGGSNLSNGQTQRIAIARAMLRDAPILLLDEATSALDAESEATIQSALENLMENRTTLVIAHRLSTVGHAHQFHVMDKGKVVESGSHNELFKHDGIYRRLCELQFQDKSEAAE